MHDVQVKESVEDPYCLFHVVSTHVLLSPDLNSDRLVVVFHSLDCRLDSYGTIFKDFA